VFVQATLGVILVNKYKFEFPKFHAFYGFVAIITVAIIYSYRTQMRHRLYLLYGLGSLFIMGLGIRAVLQLTLLRPHGRRIDGKRGGGPRGHSGRARRNLDVFLTPIRRYSPHPRRLAA